MPKRTKRLDVEIWRPKCRALWVEQGGVCQSPLPSPLCIGKPHLPFEKAQTDHIIPISKGGTNRKENLRVLCPVCHALRADDSHRGLTARLLQKDQLPVNWREFVWED